MSEPLHHRVEYTKNRHSRAVLRNGEIVIRLARNLSRTEEQQHIENLLRRMTKVAARESLRNRIDPFRPLLEGASEDPLLLSSRIAILFRLQAGARNRTKQTAEGWTITVGPTMRRRQLHALLWKVLSEDQRIGVETLVHKINAESLRVRIGAVRLKFMSSQWGSCSPHGTITLNTALLFLPQEVLTYVILHELTHRLHANHSRRFWETLESALPGLMIARKSLASFRLPTL
ncbi:MAG: M48 family metallopeptidase [Candidatus Peribacteraceae bacterium]|nr:M48 family metallopeptidase [Candidatus Peribacteraceae bacterium]